LKTIFIVDDSETNLAVAKQALDGAYRTFALASAAGMFKLLEKIVPDLILLDVNMPEMDGFEAMSVLKSDARFKSIPVMFLTSKHDAATETRCLEMGALDFVHKPFAAPVLIRRAEIHISTDKMVKESQQAVRDIHNAAISVIADMVESRDKITGLHIERTQMYLEILVNELSRSGVYAAEIATWDMSLLLPSAQLHDIGKIIVNDAILNKPGKLTDEEFRVIKKHCTEGERIIDRLIAKTKKDDGFLRHAKLFAGYHHEKWNGAGYPRGLSGQDIPLEGRIMAVADVYDALVSRRPYKEPFTHGQAVDIIKKDSGTHFDPDIAAAFLKVADDYKAFSDEHGSDNRDVEPE
jgi:putative two-component system response regulator